MKQSGIVIPDPRKLKEWGHAASTEACEALVRSILRATDLNYIRHWFCVRKASARARKTREKKDPDILAEQKAEVDNQERGQLEWAT